MAGVADTAHVAAALGVVDPPRNREELTAVLTAYRPELRPTRQAREAAHFILHHSPLPLVARPPYAVLAANAVVTLPPWARTALGVRPPALLPEGCVEPAGRLLTRTIRWAMPPAPPHTNSVANAG
ncbi:oxygenase MpaB family protein [Streptomyces sp. NPDC060366]|uniref:oxygenase MpaB family protein n=1 Tax=Streptomyces sp. NPDC060366 TaxID=3347105 RepID=UPI0036532B70